MTDASLVPTHSDPELAEIPARIVWAIDGTGAPEGRTFQAAVAALDELGGDGLLEGAYWLGEDRLTFDLERPEEWRWTLAVPFSHEIAAVSLPGGVRRETRPPESVARVVHHGLYVDEGPSLRVLGAFIAAQGLAPAGPHTELYLTDPRVTPVPQWRTELRVAVR